MVKLFNFRLQPDTEFLLMVQEVYFFFYIALIEVELTMAMNCYLTLLTQIIIKIIKLIQLGDM